MKAFCLSSLLVVLSFSAHAFTGHEEFKVELVKPWGEFGFRALGKGKNVTEMRFDCSKVSDMGLVISSVNSYGKTTHTVLPAGKLGPDKHKCQESLKQYFAGLYTKRSLASLKQNKRRTIELNMIRGEQTKRTLSFH